MPLPVASTHQRFFTTLVVFAITKVNSKLLNMIRMLLGSFLLVCNGLLRPLRVRALFLVLWPRNEKPERWRIHLQPMSIKRLMLTEFPWSPSTLYPAAITARTLHCSSSFQSCTFLLMSTPFSKHFSSTPANTINMSATSSLYCSDIYTAI